MRVNHFKRQKYWKKIRRRRKRIHQAQLRDAKNVVENSPDQNDEISTDELKWLEREKEAKEIWEKKQREKQNLIAETPCIYNMVNCKNQENTKTVPRLPFDLPFHNPFEPDFLDQSKREICHFFRKTGVCRFDIRCSRVHETPLVSDTILFVNMFNSNSMEMLLLGEDADINLEHDENELVSEYEEFYLDVEKEFSSFGRIKAIRTCRNAMRHLRGNVYVQYRNINDAVYAFSELNGRFYGGHRLSARFVTMDSWRESICGLYFRDRCPKRGICNFLHVLLNKGETSRDLHQFLNQPDVNPYQRSSGRRRPRSRTCSSLDEASTPDPGQSASLSKTRPRRKRSDRSLERRKTRSHSEISKSPPERENARRHKRRRHSPQKKKNHQKKRHSRKGRQRSRSGSREEQIDRKRGKHK